MLALKSSFDGEKITVPEQLRGMPPVEVIIVVEENGKKITDDSLLKAQEESLRKVWDNAGDADYDQL
jgi:hypothetical protein